MRFLNFIFLGVYLICTGCSDCGPSDCHDEYIGVLPLIDSTKHWVPYSASSNSLVFKNSLGDTVHFNNNGVVRDTSYPINVHENGSGCYANTSSVFSCYDYANGESQTYSFSSTNPSYQYTLVRGKDVYSKTGTGLQPIRFNDMIRITIGSTYFSIRINQDIYTDSESTTTYHASVTLNGAGFNKVYISSQKYPKAIPDVYYNCTKGLVGFTVSHYNTSDSTTTKELWVLQ